MLISVIVLASAAAQAPSALPPLCRDASRTQVNRTGMARMRPLNEEPQGRRIYTVVRNEGGCSRLVPVNDRRLRPAAPLR